MVGFGEHLSKEQTDTYEGQYLDYDMLKRYEMFHKADRELTDNHRPASKIGPLAAEESRLSKEPFQYSKSICLKNCNGCRKLQEVIDQQNEGHEAVVAAMRTILQGLFDSQIEKVMPSVIVS